MKRTIIAAALLAATSAHAGSGFVSYSQLMNANDSTIISYILGVHDMLSVAGVVCSPDNATAGDILDALIKHPAPRRDVEAADVIGVALTKEFPCGPRI